MSVAATIRVNHGKTKVCKLCNIFAFGMAANKDVLGLDIAMDNIAFMKNFDASSNIQQQDPSQFGVNGDVFLEGGQRAILCILHQEHWPSNGVVIIVLLEVQSEEIDDILATPHPGM
jgi:hypothetical protein